MYRRSFKKSIVLGLFLVIIFGMSIGYAALNSSLTITGTSIIVKNIWDVHFDNIQVMDGSIAASVEPVISNDTTISNFELTLDEPGDFYEFTVDVVNNGTIDAMIESVVKTPDLTADQKKYLTYIISYQNSEEITTKQLVKSNEFVRLKVRVELKKDITASDLPTNTEILNLGFTLNYVQSDGTGIIVNNNGKLIKIVSGNGTQVGDEICIGQECFHVISSTEDTVTLFSKYCLYRDIQSLDFDEYDSWQFNEHDYYAQLLNEYEESLIKYGVIDYRDFLEDSFDFNIIEARLITEEELENLGCSFNNSCSNAPEWVTNTGYWTMTASHDYPYVIAIFYDSIDEVIFDNEDEYGLRPVITISRSLI